MQAIKRPAGVSCEGEVVEGVTSVSCEGEVVEGVTSVSV